MTQTKPLGRTAKLIITVIFVTIFMKAFAVPAYESTENTINTMNTHNQVVNDLSKHLPSHRGF